MQKIRFLIMAALGLAIGTQAQTPGFTRGGSPLPFTTSLSSNHVFNVDRGGGLAPANFTWGSLLSQMRTNLDFRFNVLTYGADPTGTRFSGSNIQAAIDAACVRGGVVYFPPGTYITGNHLPKTNFTAENFPSSLTLWSNNVMLLGAGRDVVKISPGTNSLGDLRNFLGAPNKVYSGGWVNWYQTNLWVEGINFDMQGLGTGNGLYDTTQIYSVFGDGIMFKDLLIQNNLENDAIDVQYGGPMTVDNCIFRNIGGDGIGVQNTVSRISNTVIENCREEGLELYDQESYLVNVSVKGCKNSFNLNSVRLFANNCFFESTNNAATSWTVGNNQGAAMAVFKNSVISDLASSGPPVITVWPNRSVRFDDCTFGTSGRSLLVSTNAKEVAFSNCKFGDSGYPMTSAPVYLSGVNNFVFTDNTIFPDGAVPIVATNGLRDFDISQNRGIGALQITGGTNGLIFGNSRIVLALTNANSITVANNRGTLALLTATTNIFSGNIWNAAPSANYWAQPVSGDIVTNKLVLASFPHFQDGLMLPQGDISNPSIKFANNSSRIWDSNVGYLNLRASNSGSDGGTWTISGVSGALYSDDPFPDIYSSRFLSGSGNATFPAFVFARTSGDSDTGLFRPSEDNIGFTTGGTERLRVTPTGVRLISPTVPSSASASGTAGDISLDANYIYIATGANTWKRVAISTW